MTILKINTERIRKSLRYAIGDAYGFEEHVPESEEQKERNAKFKGACGGAFDFVEDQSNGN